MLGAGVVHKNVSNIFEFVDNLYSRRHNLLTGVNKFLSLYPKLIVRFGWY